MSSTNMEFTTTILLLGILSNWKGNSNLLVLKRLSMLQGNNWKVHKYLRQINHFSPIKILGNCRNNQRRVFEIFSNIFYDLIILEAKKRVNGSTMIVMIVKNLYQITVSKSALKFQTFPITYLEKTIANWWQSL